VIVASSGGERSCSEICTVTTGVAASWSSEAEICWAEAGKLKAASETKATKRNMSELLSSCAAKLSAMAQLGKSGLTHIKRRNAPP
jgi:hypothetical protein